MIDYISKVKEIIEDKKKIDNRERKVYSLTFGCQQNEADSEKLLGCAVSMGYVQCSEPSEADLILVNTCAIREHAELKALSVIGQFKHIRDKNPELVIGVCGCMTAQEHRVEELKHRYPYVTFTLDPSEMSMLPIVLYRHFTEDRRIFLLDESIDNLCEGMPVYRKDSVKSWLSIMYGCNNFCTYCIVPYVRGRERSRSVSAVLSEARELVSSGTREITL
ncbi:MAG: radical SAM protein, partial [Clostridia bacterium]|nr:radical SAM protein [Clostridia bacterium]